MSHDLNKRMETYRLLITQFVDGQMAAAEFEKLFLHAFKAETMVLPEREFAILEDLFLDVDAFCDNPEIRSKNSIDSIELKKRAENSLHALGS